MRRISITALGAAKVEVLVTLLEDNGMAGRPADEQERIARHMEKRGIVVTYPDKAQFIAASQPVRDKLGKGRWGDATYKKIVEIGKKDM